MNAGLRALKKVSPEAYENITGKQAMGGMKHKMMMALGGMTDEQVSQVAEMGMKAVKDYGMGGKTYGDGGMMYGHGGMYADNGTLIQGEEGVGETKPGVMTQIDNRLEEMLDKSGVKDDLANKVMNSISQGRIGERNKEKAMKEFGWDGSVESLANMPAHKIADIFKTTTQGPNINTYEILQRSAGDVGAEWNPQQNQLYTTIHHSGARNLAPDQLDTLFEESGWTDPKNAEITSNFIQQAVAGNVNFMGGEATGNRGRSMAYEMDTQRLGEGFQGRDYTFGKSEFDNQEGVFESGESDAIRFEFENAIETPESFAAKGALKDGTFNLNTVLNRREFVPTDEPQRDFQAIRLQKEYTPELMRLPLAKMLPLKDRPEFPGGETREPLPPSGLGRQPVYVASDFLPGAAGVDERGRMRPASGTFTSSLNLPSSEQELFNMLNQRNGGKNKPRTYKFGGKY